MLEIIISEYLEIWRHAREGITHNKNQNQTILKATLCILVEFLTERNI